VTDLFVPLDDHPAYRQIANVIEGVSSPGSLRTGDPLPSEMDLGAAIRASTSTYAKPSRAGNPRLVGPGTRRENGCASRARTAAREFRREPRAGVATT